MIDHDELKALYLEHLAGLERSYASALEGCGFDALVIHSGAPRAQCDFDDQHWPLRPTPAFRHWLPLAEANCALVIEPGKRATLHRPIGLDFWEGRAPQESGHFWEAFEVREVGDPDEIAADLPATGTLAFLGEDVARAARWGIARERINPAQLIAALDAVRTKKSAYERRCIAEANRRAARGHERVFETFRAGDCSELELHLLYLQATGQDDAEAPYKNIVALDEHAAVLHHVHYGRSAPAGPAHSLLVDAGATCLGYAGDVTRTAAKGAGEGADVFAELIDRIDALQQRICARVAPGVAFEDLHDLTHQLLAPILRDLDIARAGDEELVASGTTRRFLPHGLGHSLGLQVHDVGARPTPPRPENELLRATFAIAPGHVFTIEPGCYFIDSLLEELRGAPAGKAINWKLVAALRSFGGVRVEDNIAILDSGTANLTRDNWPARP